MSDLATATAALLALLATIATALWRARRKWLGEGRARANTEAMQDAHERTARGRAAVQEGRASGATPDERLRRNDGAW